MRIEKVEKRNFTFYIVYRKIHGNYIKSKVYKIPKNDIAEFKILKVNIVKG